MTGNIPRTRRICKDVKLQARTPSSKSSRARAIIRRPEQYPDWGTPTFLNRHRESDAPRRPKPNWATKMIDDGPSGCRFSLKSLRCKRCISPTNWKRSSATGENETRRCRSNWSAGMNEIWSMDFIADGLVRRTAIEGVDDRRQLHARVSRHQYRLQPARGCEGPNRLFVFIRTGFEKLGIATPRVISRSPAE